jgi:hypothetical protein
LRKILHHIVIWGGDILIYYLSSESNKDCFNFVEDDEFINVKGDFDLKTRLLNGADFSRCNVLLIDHTAIQAKTKDVTAVIQSFLKMYKPKIIYFYPGGNVSDKLCQSLTNAKVFNIITSETPEGIAREFAECMAGRSEEEARTGKAFQIPSDHRKTYLASDVNIAVFGAENVCGTTHFAYGLASYLSEYIKSGYIEVAAEAYSRSELLPKADFYIGKNGTCDALDVNIVDFGKLDDRKLAWAQTYNKFVLLSGYRPWNWQSINTALFKLGRNKHAVNLVFTPAPETLKPGLLSTFAKGIDVHFMNFAPDMGNQDANRALFQIIMRDWECK